MFIYVYIYILIKPNSKSIFSAVHILRLAMNSEERSTVDGRRLLRALMPQGGYQVPTFLHVFACLYVYIMYIIAMCIHYIYTQLYM
jgi:hypothetical protein